MTVKGIKRNFHTPEKSGRNYQGRDVSRHIWKLRHLGYIVAPEAQLRKPQRRKHKQAHECAQNLIPRKLACVQL